MGANMIPMAKKRGRTVFGVKIGLSNDGQRSSTTTVAEHRKSMRGTHCHAFNRCCRNAVSRECRRIVSDYTILKKNRDELYVV